MAKFATGKYALGECDICSLTWKLKELRKMTGKHHLAGFYACPDCYTADHPQLHTERLPRADAEALRNPRPVQNADQQRNITWGWLPVAGVEAKAELGVVTV